MNVRMLIGLKAVHGLLFVRLLIKRVQLAKELFIQETEDGGETFIPSELS